MSSVANLTRSGWPADCVDQADTDPRAHTKLPGEPGLSVDERSALCLLALARDLLSSDHHAVAMMIDYAMVDVARRSRE